MIVQLSFQPQPPSATALVVWIQPGVWEAMTIGVQSCTRPTRCGCVLFTFGRGTMPPVEISQRVHLCLCLIVHVGQLLVAASGPGFRRTPQRLGVAGYDYQSEGLHVRIVAVDSGSHLLRPERVRLSCDCHSCMAWVTSERPKNSYIIAMVSANGIGLTTGKLGHVA